MRLDDRKMYILSLVVEEYIRTGEPVGSKTILLNSNINVSSATIRNDMSALEKMGFLEQPYTSAGRIPTYTGYRLYIEKLMNPYVLTNDDKNNIDNLLLGNGATPHTLVDNASQVLSDVTGLTVINNNNMLRFSVITRVEVIPAGKKLYALIIITSTGSVKNKICRVEFDLNSEQLGFFGEFINKNLTGVNVDELTEEMMENLVLALGSYIISLTPLLYAVYELSTEFERSNINVAGQNKLYDKQDIDSLQMIKFLNEKKEIQNLLSNAFSGIEVIFGKENNTFFVNNSSIIMSPYKVKDEIGGSIGVIGPLRLDYSKVIPYVEYFSQSVTNLLSDVIDDEESEGQN